MFYTLINNQTTSFLEFQRSQPLYPQNLLIFRTREGQNLSISDIW
jgi:hypothetical protein